MGASDNLSRASLLPAGLGGRPLALGADAGEEGFGGLVGRVLRDELAAAGALEHRAAERRGAALRPLDRGAEHLDRRELLLDPRAADLLSSPIVIGYRRRPTRRGRHSPCRATEYRRIEPAA